MAHSGDQDFDLVTKVMDAAHLQILDDWLAFLPRAPHQLQIYVPDRAGPAEAVEAFAKDRGLSVTLHVARAGEDLKTGETAILKRLLGAIVVPWSYLVNLDTLPWREDNDGWLDEVFGLFAKHELSFFSTTGVVYRADAALKGPYLTTGRFSNNHALIRVAEWRRIMETYPVAMIAGQPEERFHSEWAIERWCEETGARGIRRRDSMDWRVIHVQQWDARLFETRAKFRDGRGVAKFLNPVYEDIRRPWQMYFNYPKPSLWRRMRIELGARRRRVMASLNAKGGSHDG